ncbi:hypothetical protein [Variovorax guangxiensis]|uniref:hypothetical protein n=1 Tax=Variovorax guangxiensis TaxID=1775474 RepID=UPI00285F1D21|nr:hypothetical protein [Variovorax guangxiensis]MDR6857234.1 hypothetical protein [Variovorax guangxiensis]
MDIFLFGTLGRAWTDAEVRTWTMNPWGIFEVSKRKYFLPSPAGGAGAGGTRPQVFTCT